LSESRRSASDPLAEESTLDVRYTERLLAESSRGWKRHVGCGIGRNLLHLGAGAVGVDHNRHSVAVAVARGLTVFTPDEFAKSPYSRERGFDSILLAHVAEHMKLDEAVSLLASYARLVRAGGRAVLICPQEAGFGSDPTHIEFMDFGKLRRILESAGFSPAREYSFPLPRLAGRIFLYNEFVSIGVRG